MKHPLELTIPELRAAIRGLTDTAGRAPVEAVAAFAQLQGREEFEALCPHLTDAELDALRALLNAYFVACDAEQLRPEDGWYPARSAAA